MCCLDVLRPTVGSLDLAVGNALADAGIGPDDVDVIVAHGTGVPGEDCAEADAWAAALGETARTAPAVALTGAIGSLYAGAGGAEVIAAAMTRHAQSGPPTVNFSSGSRESGVSCMSARSTVLRPPSVQRRTH